MGAYVMHAQNNLREMVAPPILSHAGISPVAKVRADMVWKTANVRKHTLAHVMRLRTS